MGGGEGRPANWEKFPLYEFGLLAYSLRQWRGALWYFEANPVLIGKVRNGIKAVKLELSKVLTVSVQQETEIAVSWKK